MQTGKSFNPIIAAFYLTVLIIPCGVLAEEAPSRGQVVYVPAHTRSSLGASGSRGDIVFLTATLSIGNPDRKNAITLKRVDYYDSAGTLVHSYLKHPEVLKPMASTEHTAKFPSRNPSSMASFLVEWESDVPVSTPFVEAIMVGHSHGQDISFVNPAKVVEEKK